MFLIDWSVLAAGIATTAAAVLMFRADRMRRTGHRGAYAGWSPATEQNDTAPLFTPDELLAYEVRYACVVPTEDAIRQDTERAVGERLAAVLRDPWAALNAAVAAAAFAG